MRKPNIEIESCLSILFVFSLVLALQWFRINHLAPVPEYIWDNVYLWDWARDVSHGNFANFVSDSHHHLRWGNWGFATVMIELFSDDVLIYYLSTIIPSTCAILLFTFLTYRNLGIVAAVFFILLWFWDALLFRATFQLLPSGSVLLPVAILVALCLHLVRSRQASWPWIVATTVTIFWIYGTKESFLAIVPGAVWLIFSVVGLRPVLIILFLGIVGYMLESFAFSLISTDFAGLGRIHSIIAGGKHIEIMTEYKSYVAWQTKYFDSGLTMRWVLTSGVTPIAIFTGFIFALLTLVDGENAGDNQEDLEKNEFLKILSILTISFVFFTTFFIISLTPLRLGQPLNPRYATILMPLIYILIIGYLSLRLKRARWPVKLGIISILPFYIAPAIDRYADYPDYNIFKISNSYASFGQEMAKFECIRAKQESIVMNQLDLIPEKYRTPRLEHLIRADGLVVHEKPWFIVKTVPGKPCASMYTIHRNVTMRY